MRTVFPHKFFFLIGTKLLQSTSNKEIINDRHKRKNCNISFLQGTMIKNQTSSTITKHMHFYIFSTWTLNPRFNFAYVYCIGNLSFNQFHVSRLSSRQDTLRLLSHVLFFSVAAGWVINFQHGLKFSKISVKLVKSRL